MDPPPLLYAGASEDVRIQIFHKGRYPSAGVATLICTVSAPQEYPGEQVVIEQGMYIQPVFRQRIVVSDDVSTRESVVPPSPKVESQVLSVSSASPQKRISPSSPRKDEPSLESEPIPASDESVPDEGIGEEPFKEPAIEDVISEDSSLEQVSLADVEPSVSALSSSSFSDTLEVQEDDSPSTRPPKMLKPKKILTSNLPEDFWEEEA